MKKLWKMSGIIVLGMVFLMGCGNGQTDAVFIVQSVEAEKSDTGRNGQNSQDQSASDQGGEQITLTLGTLGMDRRLQYAVEAYNAQSGKYYIEIVNYLPEQYDNVVWKASRDRFCMELTAGKGTDIVDLGGLAAEELGYAGVLADLNMFLTQEEKQEKYLGNILECARTGEALYDISPAFTLEFIAGDGSRIGFETGWTMEEMLKSFEKEGRDGSALGRGGAGVTIRLVQYSMADYVDWDMGTADFCKEKFTVFWNSEKLPIKVSLSVPPGRAWHQEFILPAVNSLWCRQTFRD